MFNFREFLFAFFNDFFHDLEQGNIQSAMNKISEFKEITRENEIMCQTQFINSL